MRRWASRPGSRRSRRSWPASGPCPVDRVRLLGTDPAERLALLDAGAEVDVEPLVALGTYELLRWTREQAVSTTAHRHGNVIDGRQRGA